MGSIVNENPISALSAEFEALKASNEELRESLDQAMMSLKIENVGWRLLSGFDPDRLEGPSLEELKALIETIRPHVAATGLIRRGLNLHQGYVWSKGINIDGVEETGRRGPRSALQRFFGNRVNQANLFGPSAHSTLQSTRYSDGMVLALCDTGTREVRLIPFSEVTAMKLNPDFPDEIWAYQRTWDPKDGSDSGDDRVEWIYTSRYTGPRQASYVDAGGKRVPVRRNAVIVDLKANAQAGWVLGMPDCAPALPHYSAYMKMVNEGKIVTEARAKLLMKITAPNKAGVANQAAKVAGMTGVGNAAHMLEGQSVDLIQGSERGYAFDTLDRPAGLIASALNVPLIELMANSAFAGASYGAAQAVTPSTINAMRMLQDEWISFYQEIFRVYGFDSVKIWFDPIQEPDPYRSMQAITLGSPAMTDEEYRGAVLDLMDIPGDPSVVPPTLAARTQGAQQAASPDQGRNSPAGGTDSGARNDQRSDLVGEALRASQVDEMREIVERFESALSRASE